MKKYEIEINNEVYRVSVKELEADADMSTSQTATEPQAIQTSTEPSAQSASTGESSEVKAPMAGTILKVSVTPGQTVSQGDTLVILEAMKMENEVVAPKDGVVGEIFVSANERVESDQVLLTI